MQNTQHGSVMQNDSYPFKTVGEALRFYHQNPARARFPNIFELDRKSRAYYPDFHPLHPERLWASIVNAINGVLCQHRNEARIGWAICHIGDRTTMLHPKDAAKRLGVKRSTFYRWLDRINNDLEDELVRRGLIGPRDKDLN